MQQEHHNKEVRNNNAGINQDINGEISSGQDSGKYYDAQNMRLSDHDGDKGILKKIKGEELLYPKNQPTGVYVCIGTVDVNGHLVEFFVEETGADDPIIRIDGDLVGKSDKMPWLAAYPLQIDKNENCLGGEIFVTDYNTPPMIFNIQDIIDNLLTQKYFSEFNPTLYTVNLEAPLDIPVFVELVSLGGGGGLPAGTYQYSLRYSNDSGDKTNWGQLTPPIPVVQNNNGNSPQYPRVRTYGKDSDVTIPTPYGPKIRFRVTNLAAYEYIEIRRVSYNIAAGVDFVPGGEIVAKIPISPDEISIREFIDPLDSNVEIILSDTEETTILGYIEKAKAIRYHDKRLVLMNIQTADRSDDGTFLDINGKKIFPIVEKLGKSGHNDPYNFTYKKNYTSGEKNSFAVNFFDGTGGKGFAFTDPALDNVQAPNRRTPVDADSQLYSYRGTVKAANITCVTVGQTFEVFDLEDAVQKEDVCSFKNIMTDSGIITTGKSTAVGINDYCDPSPLQTGGSVFSADLGLLPFTPTSQNDIDVTGHDYVVNTAVGTTDVTMVPLVDPTNITPLAYAPTYYTRGYALAGIDNIPSWVKAFSIVKSEIASRVVCQGLGMYSLTPGDLGLSTLGTKSLEKFWFHSPDIEQGLVSQAVLDDIAANPNDYSLQFVSPLGFFSEVYGFEEATLAKDRLIDMITYARVLHDEGQVNYGEDVNMGINDGSGGRYVTYNRYRNIGDTAGAGAFGNNGDTLFTINSISAITEDRGTVHYEIETTNAFYNSTGTGGTGNNDFNNTGLKNFTEPFYIVNIVQTGKTVRDLNINQYRSTGHYQKVESIIGIGDGSANQEYELVDERWEDCIPALDNTFSFASDESFIYLKDDLGAERIFMNSTYLSAPTIALIVADITANGFWLSLSGKEVRGLYTHTNVNDRDFTIIFNVSTYYPQTGEKIIVKYDTRLPIRFFGGDSTISENIFSPIDREADASDGDDNLFALGIGFPYRRYEINPRYYIVRNTTGLNKIQDANIAGLGYIRQMCVMYASENRVGNQYAYGLTYPFQHFPQTNYVIRPNRFDNDFSSNDNTTIASNNNLWEQYFEKYPQEWLNWKFGGFRFREKINIDYAIKGPIEFFSKPKVGFKDENLFCSRVVWSLPRQINVQDSPSLKSFPANNIYDIDDKNGRIVFAWDTQTGQTGENLYAITHSGICLLLTNKSILSNLSGDDLAVMAADKFISSQYWISNNIGSPGELWRGIAEGSVEIQQEGGNAVRKSALYFINKQSAYRLMDNVVLDIAANSYRKELFPILSNLANDYSNKISSVFNRLNNEYWFQISNLEFVFDQNFNSFVGKFTYDFDKYTFHNGKVHGSRELETYELEKGYLINENPITAFLINRTSAPTQPIEKEFISININTGKRGTMKPTRVEFLDEANLTVMCALDPLIQGSLYLKQYDGWFQFIPRKDFIVSSLRHRVQSRILYFKIIHNFEEDFKITNSIIQSKNIK
jgi:hypothetical protein